MNNLRNKLYQDSKEMTVLYIEDDTYIAKEMAQILSKLFKHVLIANDGGEGLVQYNTHKNNIDLIITDIIMPNKSGIDLIQEIQSIDNNILFIVISSSADTDYFLKLIELNIDGYLVKPIQYKKLLETLFRVLQKKVLEKENEEYKNNLQKIIDKKSEELVTRYYLDHLTQLKNRAALFEDLNIFKPDKLMIIDIINFSAINDAYGYEAGDKVLITVKNRLQEITTSACGLYKISADQFVFMHLEISSNINCQEFLHLVQSHINESSIRLIIDSIEIEIFINVVIGIAKNLPLNKLFESADIALHYAKKTHQSSAIFNKEIEELMNFKKTFNAISLVKKAFDDDRIIPYFQPIMKPKEITYECLVRLLDENGEVISPSEFLEEIKQTSYYTKLTQTMIQKSFQFFDNKTCNFSINLSFEDISNIYIINYLKNAIEEYRINDRLIIEILESESIDNFELVKEFINHMKSLGIRIAIDDFGSGYSNFAYILELEPNFIKIDGSIIKNIATDSKSFIIAKNIVQFANELNIKTIAEYVHNQDVYDKVNELGIYGKQGYYIGKPDALLASEL